MTATATAPTSRRPSRMARTPRREQVEANRSLGPWARSLLSVGIVLCFVGVTVLRPGLPNNLAYVDLVLLLICVAGLVSMTRVGSAATLAGARLLPWYWVFTVASLGGLATVGLTYWAGAGLLTTTVALLSFFSLWHLIDLYGMEGAAKAGLIAAVVMAMVALTIDPKSYRPEGYFLNPNYAGHFGVAAGFMLCLAYRQWWARALGVLSILYTIQITGSFGAVGMLLAMGAVIGWRTLQRNTAVLMVALIAVVIATGFFLTAPEPELANGVDVSRQESSDTPLNSARFTRSGNTRLDIWGQALSVWSDNPFGIGPNGVKNRDAAERRGRSIEVHSDPIGVLVERGPLGLIGFVGMWAAIWMATRPFGLARVLIIGNWVQGLFRETLHYRHMWVLLALLMVLDTRTAEAEAAERALEPVRDPFATH